MIDHKELNLRENLWNQGYWEIPEGLDTSNFDFEWRPFKHDRPYIHQFGTQWQKTGGPKFIIPNNEGIKYQDFQHAIKLSDVDNRCWRPLVPNATIDFSWHPDETEPPFIYVFGNQWYDAEIMPSYQYSRISLESPLTLKRFMILFHKIVLNFVHQVKSTITVN